jgi:hypothetical protein
MESLDGGGRVSFADSDLNAGEDKEKHTDLEEWRREVDRKLASLEAALFKAQRVSKKLKSRVQNLDEFGESDDDAGDEPEDVSTEDSKRPSRSSEESKRPSRPIGNVESEIEVEVGKLESHNSTNTHDSVNSVVATRAAAVRTSKKLMEGVLDVFLHVSIWDVALLIGMRRNPTGTGHIGAKKACWVILLMIVNLGVESICLSGFLFTVIKMRHAQFNDDALLGQKLQRYNFNQHISQFDPMTYQTRARMTCKRMYPSMLSS